MWTRCSYDTGRASLARRLEVERDGVDAVAQPGRRGAVLEHVAEVPAAPRAVHLRARHAERPVLARLDAALRDRPPVARPAGARVELLIRVEQRRAAARAAIDAVRVVIVEAAGERVLGALLAQHPVLLGRQPPAPLGLRQLEPLAD